MKRLLTILLASCSVDTSDVVFGEPRFFAPEDQAQIRAAAKDVSTFADRGVRIERDGDWSILPLYHPAGWAGFTHGRERVVSVTPDAHGWLLRRIVRHEMGHAIGMRHVDAGVMANPNGADDFSADDRTECRRVGACDD